MTKEEILEKHSDTRLALSQPFGRMDVYEMMKEFADQEKRKQAIDFHTWSDNNNVPLYSGLTIAELYDVYIESLRVT